MPWLKAEIVLLETLRNDGGVGVKSKRGGKSWK
jgi:hypothetical protein